jgi:hypothetical protein
MIIWYIFSCFGMLLQETPGNPALIHLSDGSCRQGDKIGRIFAFWVTAHFGQFFYRRSGTNLWPTFYVRRIK